MGKLTRAERRKLRRKRRKVIFYFFLYVIIFSLIIVFALKSSFFNIDKLTVKGNKNLEREEILKASSIKIGDNIFKIKKKKSEENIRALPYIKDITLKRKLPKKIEIKVVERQTIFHIQKSSGFLKVDTEGIILEEIEENQENYPLFTGIDVDNLNLGDNVFSLGLSNAIIDFIQETIDLKLIDRFHRIDLKEKNNITILLKGEILVAFGTLDNVKYKLRLLSEVLKDSEEKDIKFTKIIMNKGDNPILVTED